MHILDKKRNFFFALLILFSLVFYTFLFFTQKEDYHGDEIWSYGLSNSFYNPFLHNSGTWDDNSDPNFIQNYETWITGDTFHDYLTVQNGERFSYDSVWYNQSADVHPPFYYAVIHTLCSLFPNVFSPLFALLINYIAFIIVMVLLYKLSIKWGGFLYAFILCCFYAMSAGAEDTYTFLRMYALGAAFALLLFHAMNRYIETFQNSNLQYLFLITVLACLTHYYLIVFAFFLTAITEIYLLIKRKWKNFFTLGATMLFGVALAVVIFPSMLQHLLFRSGSFSELKVSFLFQAKLIISLIMQQFAGFSISASHTMLPVYLSSFLVFSSVILLILFILFRKEHFASRFMRKSKKITMKIVKAIHLLFAKSPVSQKILMFSLLCMYLFYIYNLPIASMKVASIRYFFPFYPLLCLALSFPFNEILNNCIHNKRLKMIIALSILAFCSISSNALASHCFFFTADERFGQQIEDLEPDAYYIITTTIPHALNNFSVSLQDKKYIYALCGKDYISDNLPYSLQTLPTDVKKSAFYQPVYLLLTDIDVSEHVKTDEITNEKWLSMFSDLSYTNKEMLIGQDTINGYKILIYQLR